MTKEQYDEILRAKPYVPKHHMRGQLSKNDTNVNNILSNSLKVAKTGQNSPHLGKIEQQNRIKFGVKKPANVWKHEMDDHRITGDQIRVNEFKSTMFDV